MIMMITIMIKAKIYWIYYVLGTVSILYVLFDLILVGTINSIFKETEA